MKFLIQGKPNAPLSLVERIVALNSDVAEFWSAVHGWAPPEAAALLSKSRLDRQVSLSASLARWMNDPDELSDGDLILAWANLGSLVEGTLKLFLSVYYEDYKQDADTKEFYGLYDGKKGSHNPPDGLLAEAIIQFFEKKKLLNDEQKALVRLVQSRRNAIHSFKDRDIGTTAEFRLAVDSYLNFARSISDRLPDPR